MKKQIGIIIILTVLFSPAHLLSASYNDYINVVASDSKGVVLELRVPKPDIKEVWEEGTLYHKIAIPNFIPTADVGSPQMPQVGALLGIPEDAIPTIEILEEKSRLLSGYKIHPAPRPVVTEEGGSRRVGFEFALDKEIYNFNGFIPQGIAKIDFTGFMREQKVARIIFYPFQFNPVTGKLRYYSRIKVRVNFNARTVDQETASVKGKDRAGRSVRRGETNAYERLLKGVLLNYD